MSEQLYRVCWQKGRHQPIHKDDYAPMTREQAQAVIDDMAGRVSLLVHYWLEPVPTYAPPAVTHEDDLTTAAGSPCMGGDDDLLGIPPGC